MGVPFHINHKGACLIQEASKYSVAKVHGITT
jgi:hypothetical protein